MLEFNAVSALYLAYFNRPADPEGLAYWMGRMDAGASFFDLAQDFATTGEAIALYPSLGQGGGTPDGFVRNIFANIYTRFPTAEDAGYWLAELEGGKPAWQALVELILAAQGSDVDFIATKLEVSLYITSRIAQSGEPYDTASARWLLSHASQAGSLEDAFAIVDGYFTPSRPEPEPNPGPEPEPEDDFSGDDTYHVDDPGVVIDEKPGRGYDTVIASISYVLPANVERLILTGAASLDGDGNDEDNEIVGNGGNNILRGFGGSDTLVGNAGDDTLDGGTGADRMEGGEGDDIYYVDDVGDVVVELPGEGTDTIYASVDYTLPYHVESLILIGSADLNGTGNDEDNSIAGNSGNNRLYGGAGNDILIGNAGNDVLDGGTGADVMEGDLGDDVFYVDDVGDVVVELPGEGTDTVYASINYTLPYHVENLILTGSADLNGIGNGEDNSITGNSGNNGLYGGAGNDVLNGGAGNDVLDGGTGADAMSGGSGDDTYYVDDAGDTVIELPDGGTDTVYVSLNTYSVPDHVEIVFFNGSGNFIGYANDMGSEIRGGAWDNTLHGGDGDDRLVGGNGNDTLYGGAGDDELYGSNGINRLIGGPGADFLSLGGTTNTVVYSKDDIVEGGTGDRITGYISSVDRFEIEVPGLSMGRLTSLVDDRGSNAFQGSASGSASPQLILSHWNGTGWDSNRYLWVDFDGSGPDGGYLIANLGTAGFVTAGDIWIT